MKSFLASVALFAVCVSLTARAADLPVKAPPALPPPYNWSGFYLGANLGGAWTSGSLPIPGNNLYGGITEFIGGVQAGYNFQAGSLLLGVEGDFDGATFGHPVLPTRRAVQPHPGSSQHSAGHTAAHQRGLELSANIVGYYNVLRRTGAPNWQL
jgi:opacity protein-like surface antigen